MTKYSVVIPSKNEEKVFDAVESVTSQEESSVEVVVVDGSEGRLQESLEQFCRDKAGVKYFHESEMDEESRSRAGSRNFGAEKSNGDIIVFMDSDCLMQSGFFDALNPYLEHHDVVECNIQYENEDRDYRCLLDRKVENSGRDYEFLTAGLAVKRKVFQRVKFDEDLENLREDTLFGLEAVSENFSYTYGENAKIKHYAGRFDGKQYLKERWRFVDEPLFRKKLAQLDVPENSGFSSSRISFIPEAGFIGLFLVSLVVPNYNVFLAPAVYLLAGVIYTWRETRGENNRLCPKDIPLALLLTIPALLVKRIAIWYGSLKHGHLVV